MVNPIAHVQWVCSWSIYFLQVVRVHNGNTFLISLSFFNQLYISVVVYVKEKLKENDDDFLITKQ